MDYRFLACLGDRVLKPGGSIVAQAGNVHRLQAEIYMEGFGLVTCPLINEIMTGGGYQDFNTRSVYMDKPYIWKLKPGTKERGWMRTLVTGMGRDKSVHEWGDTPAAFMMAIERLTQPGDLILDPFTGGGTAPAACKMLGRNYLAFEIDPETAERARQRVLATQAPLFVPAPAQLELPQ
jgi:hypothetical protein